MKNWKPGTKVHFNIPDGANATIVRYLGEWFWEIETVPEKRFLVASQDDLEEGWITSRISRGEENPLEIQ